MAAPTINFAGFVYDDAGDAVSEATVHIYDKNSTSTARESSSITTNSSGYWSYAHATPGEFDVEVVSGASKRRFKFDDKIHIAEVDAEKISIRGNEGAIAALFMYADEGDDVSDQWRVDVGTDGVLAFGNDAASQGSFVDHLTITPNSTVANSTVAFKGGVTIAGDLTVTGDDITMATNTSTAILVADGTNYNPVVPTGVIDLANDGAFTVDNTFISSQTEITSGLAAADELLYSDGGTVKKIGLDNLVELGPALSTEDAIANGDYILFLDGGASGNMNKEAVHDLATLFAGSGLTATNSVIAVDTLNQDTSGTAAIATTVTITDNESTDEDNAIIFTSGGDVDGGNIGLESDGTLTYNPSTGKITATGFLGAIDGILGANSAAAVTGTTGVFTTSIDITGSAGIILENDETITNSTNGTVAFSGGIAIPNAGNIGSASDLDAIAIASNGVVNFTQAPTVASAAVLTAGVENIWVPAAAMTPRDNAGCAALTTVAAGTNGRPDFHVLDFDNSSDEHAQFTIAMPKSWDGGNVYYYVYWIGLAATTGVTWGLEVLSLNDNEEFNQAYVNPILVDDDSQGDVTELLVSAKSAAIACSGADNDLLCFQVYRDVSAGNDDMAGDARLWGLLLEYTTNAATDA